MTILELKQAISNLPDDGEVFVQRIEDIYFEKHNWPVKRMKGETYYRVDQWNKDVDSGKYLDKEEYPHMKQEMLKKYSQEELDSTMEQYIDTHCCINYDGKNLYITSHY